jgi:hypothetical protein
MTARNRDSDESRGCQLRSGYSEAAADRIREQHIPALLAAVEAVLALHQPEPGQHPDFCGACLREMPCPTTLAISRELPGEVPGG